MTYERRKIPRMEISESKLLAECFKLTVVLGMYRHVYITHDDRIVKARTAIPYRVSPAICTLQIVRPDDAKPYFPKPKRDREAKKPDWTQVYVKTSPTFHCVTKLWYLRG